MAVTETARQQLLIGGEWSDGDSGREYQRAFPFTPSGTRGRTQGRSRA
jgi:hypothetical protein